MNQQSLSSARTPVRPSFSSRRSTRRLSSFSGLEEGDHVSTPNPLDNTITEELAQIKKYEDFTTIDWVQDAAREQTRRKTRRQGALKFFHKDGKWGWRRKLWESYDAAQAWVVVTLVAIVIGLNAAALNIITEYLSDLKMGYCTTAWYLNEDFCCYGAEDGCDEWVRWTRFAFTNYLVYATMACLLAATAAYLVKWYAPYAAGSGISEIKCIIGGFVMKGFLGFWTLLIKSICLPLAIASGLSVGKEGPSVHYATCVGNVISRLFDKYKQSASKTREILTASAGTGVAVAFGSPIGGVLFSLEEMASHFPLKTLWRSYFCALVATAVLAAINPFRTGQLVMFSVKYDRSWHFFEIVFYVVLGIFGGVYGAVMIKGHLAVTAFRKKHLARYAVPEAVVLAGVTALLCYPNLFLRVEMTEMMEMLFRECEGDYDYHGLCEAQNRLSNVLSLFTATFLRAGLVALSYGAKVPAGIFVPSMAIGASFGRMLGILVEWLHASYPNAAFFSACEPDVPCITPGTYAFLGAGAALSGIMHLTISVTVIMFELTGALTYILPSMIVIGVTKAVGDQLSKSGIADVMIQVNGYPFLDTKEQHNFGVPASEVMTPRRLLRTLPATGLDLKSAQKILDDTSYSTFPIIESADHPVLIGYIGHTELQYALTKVRQQTMLPAESKISFVQLDTEEEGEEEEAAELSEPTATTPFFRTFRDASTSYSTVDFSPYTEPAPMTVHPRLPLETTMELFQKMGPRVILVEHHGILEGLITVKDCLKYQAKVEARHQQHRNRPGRRNHQLHESGEIPVTANEEIWHFIINLARRVGAKITAVTRGQTRHPRTDTARHAHPHWSRLSQSDATRDYTPEDELLGVATSTPEHEQQDPAREDGRQARRYPASIEMDVR